MREPIGGEKGKEQLPVPIGRYTMTPIDPLEITFSVEAKRLGLSPGELRELVKLKNSNGMLSALRL